QQDSELLSESQRPLRQRRALDPLRELENDLAAVEYRHGEQVQDAEADADDGEKAQERAEARLRAVPRIAGDGYRSRNITHRDVAHNYAPEHADGQCRHLPSLRRGSRDAVDRPVALLGREALDQALPFGRRRHASACDADLADLAPVEVRAADLDLEHEPRGLARSRADAPPVRCARRALDEQRHALSRAGANRGREVLERLDRLAVDLDDAVAGDEAGPISRAAGRDLADLGRHRRRHGTRPDP